MTTVNTARRAFLRGRRDPAGLRPRMPWATEHFLELCQRCDDCVVACEESIVVAGEGGFPTVDFQRGGCTYCGACVSACQHGALDDSISPPWQQMVSIGDSCLSAQGITCRSCGDSCESRAIRFRLQLGGRALPELDAALCNGCGSCIATCPTHVIKIQETT